MKILHTSDWHLGKSIFGKCLLEDQEYFINNFFINILQLERPDFVIIAGDIFDKAIAPSGAIRLFSQTIEKINKLNIGMCIISGNHDSQDRMAIASNLLKKENIHIVTEINSNFDPIKIKSKDEEVNVYAIPFMSTGLEQTVTKISQNLNTNEFNMIVSHCFAGQEIDCDVFSKFDYVALGHLHSRQQFSENIFYSGSPLSYSFNEQDSQKYLTLIKTEKKSIQLEHLKFNPLHKMRTLKGTFEQLINLGKTSPSEDYILIELTDDFPVYMPITQLRVYFPNILALECDWIKSKISDKIETSQKATEKINDEDIFARFLKDVCDYDATNEDFKIFYEQMKRITK